MPAQLLSLTEGPSILLDKPVLLMGRHAECDVQLNSRKVSRKHCCIAQVKDYLVVRDLDSTNGVRINGTRVREGVLRSGDELTIGNFRYQVHTEPARESVIPVRPARKRQPSDEQIESSDDPIPLPEASGIQAPPARKAGKSKSSLRLPENIGLQPIDHPSSLGPPVSPPPV